MKVRDDGASIRSILPGQQAQGRKEAVSSAASFDRLLHEESLTETRDALNRLLDRITAQGEIVARHRNINDVRKYRELVADFLDGALRSTYETDKENMFDAKGRYKEFAIVKKINAGLEDLTRTVLEDQKDNLAILEQLGTIRGLLVDLMI